MKSLGKPPQEGAPCFQSHFLISSSEFPIIIEFHLGPLVIHLSLLAFHSVDAQVCAVSKEPLAGELGYVGFQSQMGNVL